MSKKESVIKLWNDFDQQNWSNLAIYFTEDATINWVNTNESFTVSEYIQVNREYPGDWGITMEWLEEVGDSVVAVARVYLINGETSYHSTSFYQFEGGKINEINEFWSNDGKPPQWRIDMKIGKPIC